MLIKAYTTSFAPVVHPRNWDLVRVPVRRVSGEYVVYVADGYHRRYDDHTLPDELKTKLAMILATDWTYRPDDALTKLMLYTNEHSPALDEIGWRVSESYFCLVLTRLTVAAMKGEGDDKVA
jgi:hypothetical protein